MSAVYVECPECGWEGPHDGFSINEAECGDCHCEFSYATTPAALVEPLKDEETQQ